MRKDFLDVCPEKFSYILKAIVPPDNLSYQKRSFEHPTDVRFLLTQWDAYVNSILHYVKTIFVLIITNNASSQVHDCTSQEAAGVVCSSCRCGLEGSRRIVGGVESTVSCFHFSECDRFVTICHTTPLVRVGNIRGLQHSTFTQRTEPIQAGFVTIIWFSKHHILDLRLSLS